MIMAAMIYLRFLRIFDLWFCVDMIRNLGNIVLFNLFLLFIGLSIIELVFGSWFRSSNKLFHLNMTVDKKLVYNLEGLYESENQVVTYTRDEFGLRGAYNKVGDIDILTVGGSTTDQKYITDGSTWQDVLQRRFESEGKKIVVANAGVDGQSTYGHIKNFSKWFNLIPNLKPKYFLFFIGVNDFHVNYGYQNDLIKIEENSLSLKQAIKRKIKNKSILFNLFQMSKNIFSAYHAGIAHPVGHSSQNYDNIEWIKGSSIENHNYYFKERLLAFEKRLEILCQKVKEYDATPIFVTQSNRRLYRFVDGQLYGDSSFKKKYDGLKINAIDYYHIICLFNKITEKVSEINNAIFLDLNSEVEFNLKNDFYDSCHHTPSGAQKVGDYLFNKLNHILL